MTQRPPKVAIVHDHLVQDGGAEQVVRVLMKIWPEAPVYTLVYNPEKMGPDFAGHDIRTSIWQKVPGAVRRYKWLLPFIDGAFRRFDLSEYDLVISSSSGFAKSVQTNAKTLHLCYCYTPTRYLWSDSERYVEELPYPGIVKRLISLMMPKLRQRDLRGAAGVDAYVAISKHVAERIRRYYHRDADIIYPPVALAKFRPTRSPKKYFLTAGRLEPYKRVDLAIEACNRLKLPLKIMGDGTDRSRLAQLAGPTVKFLGRVSDTERQKLYAEANALINPQEEDFGITVVESLASGTPVIAYDIGGAAEIIRDETGGVLFNRQTVDSLTEALRTFDRAKFTQRRLVKRAEDFSEANFIKRIQDFVEKSSAKFSSVDEPKS